MARLVSHRLDDIEEQIAFLTTVRAQHDKQAFMESLVLRFSCQYAVLIIAEAVAKLPAALLANYESLQWHRIKAIGNKLRHEYHRVKPLVIWDIMDKHLVPLAEGIQTLRRHVHSFETESDA